MRIRWPDMQLPPINQRVLVDALTFQMMTTGNDMSTAGGSWVNEQRIERIGQNGNEGLRYGAGLKFDHGKARIELLIQGMPRALESVAQVLTFGAEKYAAHSWLHVEDNTNRYWGAKLRHEIARAKGEASDQESGLLHLAHEACNCLFLLEIALREREEKRQ